MFYKDQIETIQHSLWYLENRIKELEQAVLDFKNMHYIFEMMQRMQKEVERCKKFWCDECQEFGVPVVPFRLECPKCKKTSPREELHVSEK